VLVWRWQVDGIAESKSGLQLQWRGWDYWKMIYIVSFCLFSYIYIYIYIVSSSVRTAIVKVNGVLTLLLEIDFLFVETVTLDGWVDSIWI
jgi:hypothetical protein